MSFPAFFYSNIHSSFTQPCLVYINKKTSFWHTYASLKLARGPHCNNVEILPMKLNKEGFMKLLKDFWERHCYLDNRNSDMIK